MGRHRRRLPSRRSVAALTVTMGLVLLATGPATAGLASPASRMYGWVGPARRADPGSCAGAVVRDRSMTLRVPRMGLTAPVLDGVDPATLDRGVGRVPASDWPGQGTAVLAAHNIGLFHSIDQLQPGDEVVLAEACRAWVYAVAERKVINAGDPVYRADIPTLVLLTCWPLDANYTTPHRYLVTATLRVPAGPAPAPG
jgi:LPXTG-site transpeptidase (sortase) family protein